MSFVGDPDFAPDKPFRFPGGVEIRLSTPFMPELPPRMRLGRHQNNSFTACYIQPGIEIQDYAPPENTGKVVKPNERPGLPISEQACSKCGHTHYFAVALHASSSDDNSGESDGIAGMLPVDGVEIRRDISLDGSVGGSFSSPSSNVSVKSVEKLDACNKCGITRLRWEPPC